MRSHQLSCTLALRGCNFPLAFSTLARVGNSCNALFVQHLLQVSRLSFDQFGCGRLSGTPDDCGGYILCLSTLFSPGVAVQGHTCIPFARLACRLPSTFERLGSPASVPESDLHPPSSQPLPQGAVGDDGCEGPNEPDWLKHQICHSPLEDRSFTLLCEEFTLRLMLPQKISHTCVALGKIRLQISQ
ncbi:unnamed protein product [Effrenium voratum]|uniref:Uncharacterized protein n=1 Tax=Effrenium voratum TaxID=2562239 RepID=A0AA36HPM2_9DINO|nr:unnamed protein product [Effrenium voratum]CAJ1445396.1 unnamed protein product [Effrenium voratum]